ncbi:MAG: hypothetical protein IAI48_00390 [Candidatus Eremiobacteraeota bacterium]|nr:hypothetical protein [Candidatus Eremiobacteraeota bacterium]
MNETTPDLSTLTGIERSTYERAVRKVGDPTAKDLTEKEHAMYDRIHGEGASTAAIAAIDAKRNGAQPSARDQALGALASGASTQPTTFAANLTPEQQQAIAEEEARVALEAQRPIPPEDEALFDRRSARGGIKVPVDNYEFDERSVGSADAVAEARRVQLGNDGTRANPRRDGIFEAPSPFDTARPHAPLPGDADQPAGAVVDARTSTRPRVDSSEFVQQPDVTDQLLGSPHRRLRQTFDHLRDSGTGHRHVFSRHYFMVGVLVDLFSGTGSRIEREVADKVRAITEYNAACVDPREKLGYLAVVAGVELGYDDVAPALRREIVTSIIRPEQRGGGEALDPSVILNFSQQMPLPKGSVRVGERPLELEGGRSPMAVYYHDAMTGAHTVEVDAVRGQGPSRDAAEANARALLRDAVPA